MISDHSHEHRMPTWSRGNGPPQPVAELARGLVTLARQIRSGLGPLTATARADATRRKVADDANPAWVAARPACGPGHLDRQAAGASRPDFAR